MAPLVVIRSGSKYVEYRESRAEWMRQQQLKLHDLATGGGSFSFSGSSDARARADDDQEEEEQQQQEDADFHDDDSGDDNDEARFLQRRSSHRHLGRYGSSSSVCTGVDARRDMHSFPLGLSTDLHAQDGMRGFNCADCGNMVADRDDVVARTFFGRTGKAFLMNNMFNIRIGTPRNRYLMTGMHTIADVCCNICDSVLGWKYIKAMETSQKYKEGKFILEKALVQDDSEEKAWQRH